MKDKTPVKDDADIIRDGLCSLAFFALLSPVAIDGFARQSTLRTLAKGATIFTPEAHNDRFFIVASGWIKLYRETPDGMETITDIISTGGTFGEIGLSAQECMPYGAEVVDAAQIIALPKSLIIAEFMRNSPFGMGVLRYVTLQKLNREVEIEHRTVQNAPQRIGCFLLQLAGNDRDIQQPGILKLPYDKTMIAKRLGMQPETFSRALARLRAETGIDIEGSVIRIRDMKKLADYSCMLPLPKTAYR